MRHIDLNLLVVFEAIERERSVTRAATALGLSQPAVSHALNRLRNLLKDQLFVRVPGGVDPTPRASTMAGPVREALGRLRASLDTEHFDPITSRETFTIAVDNFAAIVLVAPLALALARQAPHTRMTARPSGTLDLEDLLSRGAVDLAIGEVSEVGPGTRRHLLDDRYVAVMRLGHPVAKRTRLTAKALATSPHLRISSISDDTGFIDAALKARGLTRSITIDAPYLAVGSILEQSDTMSVVGRRIAVALCSNRDLTLRDLPFKSPTLRIGMTWAQLFERKQSHLWLRSVIKGLSDT